MNEQVDPARFENRAMGRKRQRTADSHRKQDKQEKQERGGRAARAELEGRAPDDGRIGGEGPRPHRRRVLSWIWSVLGLAALGEGVVVTMAFLSPRKRQLRSGSVLVAGPMEDFEPGSVTAFPAGSFYLVRLNDGGFLALHRECTHLGCTVPWSNEQQRFPCPCHASAFDIKGQVLSPPAPRPLDLLALRIENGIVKVDSGRRVRRSEFQPSQVVRA